ncbi:MAG: DUF3109 family protein [Prevotellaceae bacterium]|jgi:hypothetical protein|nr:DUF3109 family protein [Prevotellaceae bacterium]
MLQIQDTIVSLDLLERKFVCDLAACRGECCVEGEEGAPLEADEIEQLEKVLPIVWDDLPEESKTVINKQGVSYIDRDGEPVTSIVNGAECVFVYTDENGYAKCAIEKAFLEGKTAFRKPISCYLYPVRVDKYASYSAVNYHRWHICRCAEQLGERAAVPVYKFLKEALIGKFGAEWYRELELTATEYKKYVR